MYPDAQLVDLGCNIGVFTLTAASMGIPVLAVDILPANLALLQLSIHLNDARAQNYNLEQHSLIHYIQQQQQKQQRQYGTVRKNSTQTKPLFSNTIITLNNAVHLRRAAMYVLLKDDPNLGGTEVRENVGYENKANIVGRKLKSLRIDRKNLSRHRKLKHNKISHKTFRILKQKNAPLKYNINTLQTSNLESDSKTTSFVQKKTKGGHRYDFQKPLLNMPNMSNTQTKRYSEHSVNSGFLKEHVRHGVKMTTKQEDPNEVRSIEFDPAKKAPPTTDQVEEILKARQTRSSVDAKTGRILVDGVCLDDLIPYLRPGKRVFLKMDVEGSEADIIRCSSRFMEEVNVQVILMEIMFHRYTFWGIRMMKHLRQLGMIPSLDVLGRKPLNADQVWTWPDNVYWVKGR